MVGKLYEVAPLSHIRPSQTQFGYQQCRFCYKIMYVRLLRVCVYTIFYLGHGYGRMLNKL